MLTQKPKRYRYPAEIISYAIWMYHRFNTSYRDIEEMLRYRGILVSYETVRTWSNKFGKSFAGMLPPFITGMPCVSVFQKGGKYIIFVHNVKASA